MLYLVRGVLWPFVVSWMLAYLLNPVVTYFEVQGVKRSVIVLLFYLISVGLLAVGVFIFLPQLMDELAALKNHLPVYISQIKASLVSIATKGDKYYPAAGGEQLSQMLIHKIQSMLQGTVSNAPAYLVNIFALFSLFILIPFITFSLLLEWKKLTNNIFNWLPSRYVETVLSIICEINEVLGGFIRGQVIRLIWMSFLTIAGLIYLQMDYAILLGFFVGLTNIIPYIGNIIGAIPLVLMALFKYGLVMALKVTALIIILQIIDSLVISPYTMTKSVNLHFILVIFAVLAGAELFGFLGVILGVPIFCALKVTAKILFTRNQVTELAGVPELDSRKVLLEQFKA